MTGKMSRIYWNLLPLLVVAFLTTYFCGAAYSDEESDKYTSFVLTVNALTRVEDEIDRELAPVRQLETVRAGLVAKLGESASNSRQNVKKSIKERLSNNILGAVEAVIDQIGETVTGVDLVGHLESVEMQMDEWIDQDINAIFTRPNTGYNDTYERSYTAYKALNNHYKAEANYHLFGDYGKENGKVKDLFNLNIPKQTIDDYKVAKLFLSRCATPTGTCYSYLEDPNDHQHFCQKKHGVSGKTNVGYWYCQTSKCPRSGEHWIECRALCGTFFPPPTRTNYFSSEQGGITTVTEWHDHEVVCAESVHSIWNGMLGYQATCGKKYFTCQGGCQHRSLSGIFPNERSGTVTFYHSARLITEQPYSQVYWYIKKPSDTSSGRGTQVLSVSGDGSSKESNFGYQFTDQSESGTWTVTASASFASSALSDYSYSVTVNKPEEEGSGSQDNGGGTDTNNFVDPSNNGNNGNPAGNGDTTVERCGRSDCNEILNDRNRSEHEYVTCEGCEVGYYICDSSEAYNHAWVACRRATCPRKRGTGITNLYWRYRCQPNPSGTDNPFACTGGLPHYFQ